MILAPNHQQLLSGNKQLFFINFVNIHHKKSISVRKSFLFLFILFISISVYSQVDIKKSNEVVVFNGKEYYIHSVEKGHTLYSLARVYEIPIDEIIFENPSAKDHLSIGQELKIPVNSRDEAVIQSLRNDDDKFFYHIAKRGESLRDIASIYLISIRDLESSNPDLYDPLKTGQYIKIPVAVKQTKSVIEQPVQTQILKNDPFLSNTNFKEHIIKIGDNLYRIAIKYEISIEEIKEVNSGLSEVLYIGQRIKIPHKKKVSDFILHRVKRKTRLTRIARNYNVEIQALREYNPYVADKLKSGDIIKIPLNIETEIDETLVLNIETPIDELLSFEGILNQDSVQCMNYMGSVLDTFKVALMIPLFLEEVDSLKFTEDTNVAELLEKQPFQFLQFYYGMMMAVDSLKAMGMNVELTVFDVDKSIGKTIQVLQDPDLPEQDMIIGPFYSRSFKLASSFAKIFEIPIINPLTNRSGILEDNPFVYKCKSTTDFQYEKVRDLVATYFSDSKIFLVKHGQQINDLDNPIEELEFPLYISEFQYLIDTGYYIQNEDIFELIIEKSLADTSTVQIYNEFIATLDSITGMLTELDTLIVEDDLLPFISIEGFEILTDSIEFNLYDSTYIKNTIVPYYYATDSIYGFTDAASIYRKNVVFIFTDDNVFALDLMTKLNIERDTFTTTVVGLPKWQDFGNMDNEIMSNLNVHVLTSDFVNYKDRNTNHFIYEFRKRYLTEPLDYAFNGFDIGWYFLNALNSFGKSFENCLPYYKQSYIQTKMEFERTKEGEGFENHFWTILKYDRYRLKEIPVFPPKPIVLDSLQTF